MTATAPAHEERATAFAAAVRARLNDLSPDELDELLDGLQSDLAERLADGGELGDPAAYAEELRQAAGLPHRAGNGVPRPRLRDRIAAWEAGIRSWAGGSPARRGIRDFLVALRPAWWVLRGLIVSLLLLSIGWPLTSELLLSPPAVVLTLALVVLSVQWGRGSWLLWRGQRWIAWLGNLALAILMLPLLGHLLVSLAQPYPEEEEPWSLGLSSDGTQIGNIFAYDCSGRPIEAVQLFTRDGEPLTTLEDGQPPALWDDATERVYRYEQNADAAGASRWSGWNVFPLRQALEDDFGERSGAAQPAPLPYAQVPALGPDCDASGSSARDRSEKSTPSTDSPRGASRSSAAPSDPATDR